METLLPALTEEAAKLAAIVVAALFAYLTKVVIARLDAGLAKDVALELATKGEAAVRHVDQVVRPVLVDKAKDGTLSAEDMGALKAAAIAALRDAMANKSLQHIQDNSYRVDDVLGINVEAAVSRKKDALSIAPPRMFPAPSESDELSFRRDPGQ